MKIYDSVHGFIHFNELESALIDTEVFQRLRYIHQLGVSYMIYPGATHTRFEHSLGTMHLSTQIFDQIAPEEDRAYWRQLVRLAALCHDLGHLPFSHVAEKQLLGRSGHEEWTLKLMESDFLAPIWEKTAEIFPGKPIVETLAKLSLGEEKIALLRPKWSFSVWEKIYSQIITGDFFGADRIDYLLRDARATGLSYGLFDYNQLIEMLTILPDEKGEITIGIEENGIASCEALLLARHFMQRRVYQYSSARAYSFHMARFMQLLYRHPSYTSDIAQYISMSEQEILCKMQQARSHKKDPGYSDAEAFFDRKKRFQAIDLPHHIKEEDLKEFKEKLCISYRNIYWDLAHKNDLQHSLALQVRRKNAQITPACEFSEIAIPSTKKNWLYLSPEYSFLL